MVKVALVTHQFPSAEHPYIVDWARALVKAGVDLTIYGEQAGAGEVEGLAGRVRLLNTVGRAREWWRANFWSNLGGILKAREVLRAWSVLRTAHAGKPLTATRKLVEYLPLLGKRFDIVHFNAPQIAVRRFELGRLLGGKTLVSFRGQDFSFDAEKFKALLSQADHLHFIAQHLVELAGQAGYAGGIHKLIAPPVDVDFYRPAEPARQKREGEPWALFSAGRFTWVKGWEYALQATALLVERGWDIDYTIAGDGEMRDAVIYTIHELNLQDRVHLVGWLGAEGVRARMQKADLYLMASVNEAFNNSVLQAQACGVPVVCSDAGGLPENIEDGVTGKLFRRRDAWDMAEKVESLMRQPQICQQMRQAARERVVGQFSMVKVVQTFKEFYEEVVG